MVVATAAPAAITVRGMMNEMTLEPSATGSMIPSLGCAPSAVDDPLLPPPAAAKLLTSLGLKTAPSTLAKWRCCGGSPARVTWGTRSVLYRRSVLLAWARARLSAPRRSTSEPKATAAGEQSGRAAS